METGQHPMPVVSNGTFLGFIRRQDLMNALDRLGNRAPAYAAIGTEPEGLNPDLLLTDALPKLAAQRTLPVVKGQQLVGLITPASIQQCLWLHQRRKGGANPPAPEESSRKI